MRRPVELGVLPIFEALRRVIQGGAGAARRVLAHALAGLDAKIVRVSRIVDPSHPVRAGMTAFAVLP
ncbi:hypothetical protein AB0M46_42155 [Dactylosporangium sp. NPDC051485]|uniref:hypothetical protein n=1 Tax=Dactylosporangium sp. NPDC051485 TaxID=3154846 RepID=UPI003416394C